MSKRRERGNSDKGYSDRKVGTRDTIPTFLIVCEGEKTEPNYFRSFPVSTRPEIDIVGAGCETIAVVNQAVKLRDKKSYDRVWCVFDRDPSRVNNTKQRFNDALRLAEQEGIKVAYSNECFEIWYLLHFNFYNTAIPRSDYRKMLTKLLGYEYEKNSDDMYAQLEDRQPQAIKQAQKLLASYNPPNPESDNPATTVHLLVEELNNATSS
jgi:RloB-like protein